MSVVCDIHNFAHWQRVVLTLLCFLSLLFTPMLLAAVCHEAQVVSAFLPLCLPLVAVFQWKALLFVCHTPTQTPTLLGCWPLLTAPAPPRISWASSVPRRPFPLPNVCVVLLILLSFPLVYMYYVCAYMHAHTYTHMAIRYKWLVLCSWILLLHQSPRWVNPSAGVCLSVRQAPKGHVPDPGLSTSPLSASNVQMFRLSCSHKSLWLFSASHPL